MSGSLVLWVWYHWTELSLKSLSEYLFFGTAHTKRWMRYRYLFYYILSCVLLCVWTHIHMAWVWKQRRACRSLFSPPTMWVLELTQASVLLVPHNTFWWSPSKSCRKLACVPVVPFTPRKRSSSRTRFKFWRSMQRSWIQRQQRFPTVVSWAGLKGTQREHIGSPIKVYFHLTATITCRRGNKGRPGETSKDKRVKGWSEEGRRGTKATTNWI